MKGFWRSAAVLTVGILAGSSLLYAHEECDDVPQHDVAVATNVESAGPHFQPMAAVTIQLFQYQPGQLEIKAGMTVIWFNQDDIRHTVTLGTPDGRGENVQLEFPAKGATASFTFDRPGIYEYFCDRHPSIRGQIRVQ